MTRFPVFQVQYGGRETMAAKDARATTTADEDATGKEEVDDPFEDTFVSEDWQES